MESDELAGWLTAQGLPGYQFGFRDAGYSSLRQFLAADVGPNELRMLGIPSWKVGKILAAKAAAQGGTDRPLSDPRASAAGAAVPRAPLSDISRDQRRSHRPQPLADERCPVGRGGAGLRWGAADERAVRAWMPARPPVLSEQYLELHQLFVLHDADGDGRLGFNEYNMLLRSERQLVLSLQEWQVGCTEIGADAICGMTFAQFAGTVIAGLPSQQAATPKPPSSSRGEPLRPRRAMAGEKERAQTGAAAAHRRSAPAPAPAMPLRPPGLYYSTGAQDPDESDGTIDDDATDYGSDDWESDESAGDSPGYGAEPGLGVPDAAAAAPAPSSRPSGSTHESQAPGAQPGRATTEGTPLNPIPTSARLEPAPEFAPEAEAEAAGWGTDRLASVPQGGSTRYRVSASGAEHWRLVARQWRLLRHALVAFGSGATVHPLNVLGKHLENWTGIRAQAKDPQQKPPGPQPLSEGCSCWLCN